MLLGCVCTGFVWSYLVVRVQPAGLAFVVGLCPLTRCECMIILDAIYTRSTLSVSPAAPRAPRALRLGIYVHAPRSPSPRQTPPRVNGKKVRL